MPEMHNLARKHQKPTVLVWIDLEMTGLNTRTDLITEIAMTITDYKFNELARFETTIKYPVDKLKSKFMLNEFWVKRPAEMKQMIKDCQKGISLQSAQNQIIKLIHQHVDTDKEAPILAGNSIHSDKIFIEAKMKKLA